LGWEVLELFHQCRLLAQSLDLHRDPHQHLGLGRHQEQEQQVVQEQQLVQEQRLLLHHLFQLQLHDHHVHDLVVVALSKNSTNVNL
jgi:hypothetical protein